MTPSAVILAQPEPLYLYSLQACGVIDTEIAAAQQ